MLIILAKEGISVNTLWEDPPDKLTLPPEPIYEENVENSTAQSERDLKTRNEQLKNTWLSRFQKNELAGKLCGDRPWRFCDNKAVSLTYLSLGMEGLRMFGSQEPTIQIDRISTKDLWESLDHTFTKNITFDRYTFLTRNQLKREPVDKSYGCLRDFFFNCDLGSHEESLIRDVFISNMQDSEIHRELLKETRSAKTPVEVAINIEMGIQNQLKMSRTAILQTTSEVTTTSIKNIQSSRNQSRPLTSNFTKTTICCNCGYGWSSTKLPCSRKELQNTVELQIFLEKYVESINNK